MRSKLLKNIALIFVKYNLPSQPYLKNMARSLKSANLSINIFSHDVVMHSDLSVLEIAQSGRSGTIRKIITSFIMWPFESLKWFLGKYSLSLSEKVNLWGRYAPLIALRPTVIHLLNVQLYPKCAFIIDLLQCISIASFRGYDTVVRPFSDKNWQPTLDVIFSKCNYLHYVSNYLRKEGIKIGAVPNKAVTIYPGIDVSFYKPSNREIDDSTKLPLTIITVGRLEWEKGYSVGLKAIKILKENGYDVQYYIIGDGGGKDQIVFLTKELDICSNVTLFGYLTPVKVKSLLCQSDIYIQPSFYEALGVAVIEASAMELPIVASNVGGLPEVVEHGHTGILIPPDNPEALAKAIISLVNDKKWRIAMGKNGRKKIVKEFSLEREVREWVALYERAIYL